MIKKTALITAASIGGVILAGGAAIGANVGILSAADDTPFGSLSAEVAVTTPDSATTDMNQAPETAIAGSIVDGVISDEGIQSFTVDDAGIIELEVAGGQLAIKSVSTNAGWSWQATTSEANPLAVSFTSGSRVLEFAATLESDGSLSASLNEPVIVQSPSPTTRATEGESYGNDHDDDYDDDESDDDDDDDRGHEGRDDDD